MIDEDGEGESDYDNLVIAIESDSLDWDLIYYQSRDISFQPANEIHGLSLMGGVFIKDLVQGLYEEVNEKTL